MVDQFNDSEDLDQILNLDDPLPNVSMDLFPNTPIERVYCSQLEIPISLSQLIIHSSRSNETDSGLGTIVSSQPPIFVQPIPFFDNDVDIFADLSQTQRLDFGKVHTTLSERFHFPVSQFEFQLTEGQPRVASQFTKSLLLSQVTSSDDETTYPIVKRIQRYTLPKRSQLFFALPAIRPTPSLIPESIMNLYQKIKAVYTDYAFAHAISAQLCQDALPMDAYVTLKQSLLLSIISAQNHHNSCVTPMSILAVGMDNSSVALIMNRMGLLAQRFTSPMELRNCPVTEPEYIELSPFQLAQNGVCYIGEWLRLKPTCAYFLRKILDCGRAPTANTTIETPLTCSIWMHWTCSVRNFRRTITDSETFLNIFGIPIVLEENVSDSIVDCLLNEAMNGNSDSVTDEFSISHSDMMEFVAFVSKIEAKMEIEAENLLHKYFMVTRDKRPNSLTQRALIMLRQLAEAHAKLCARDCILKGDVLAAISIAEKFINGFFGSGYVVAPQQQPVTHVEQADVYMSLFEESLTKYIDSDAVPDI